MGYEMVRFVKQAYTSFTQPYVIAENTQQYFVFHCDEQYESKVIDFTFIVERNACIRAEFLLAHTSAALSITCILQGEGAEAIVTGAYILHADNKVSIVTRQQHDSPCAKSTVTLKGVLYDDAHASYTGMICVPKESHSTVASQENKSIVLSDHARVVSVPQLEVLTNDVHCFHGSAVGRLDEAQLFYCAARGIDHKHAQRLLLQGFLINIFESDEAKKALEKYL